MKRRWIAVWLLFLAGAINFLDRSALPLAAPIISKEFDLSPSEMGVVFSSFFVGYTVFCFVGGTASDRFGPRRVFSFAMFSWSIFCGVTAVATSFASLVVIRMFFGAGEGPFNSTANKFVSNWFPKKEVATAAAISNAGTTIGGALAGPLIGLLIVTWGWRIAFIVVAALGIVWLVAWLLLTSDNPRADRRVSEEELREITVDAVDDSLETQDPTSEPILLRHYFSDSRIIATAMAFFSLNYILYFFLSWFPSYLASVHGLNIKDIGTASMIPWLCGFAGFISGGVLSDRIYRKTNNLLFSRKMVIVTFLLASAAAIVFAGLSKSLDAAVALTSIAMFLMYLTVSCYWAIIHALVPKTHVGGVSGYVHALSNVAGIIGPTVTGFTIEYTHSYLSAFVTAGAIAVVGAFAVLIFVRPRQAFSDQGIQAA